MTTALELPGDADPREPRRRLRAGGAQHGLRGQRRRVVQGAAPRRDLAVHAAAGGLAPPRDRPDGRERAPAGRRRDHRGALRLLGDRPAVHRDRRLRHRREGASRPPEPAPGAAQRRRPRAAVREAEPPRRGRAGSTLAELERRVEVVARAHTREEAAAADGRPAGAARRAAARARPRWGRGHGDADAPGVDWRPTSERFRDPRTNRVMRVWEDAAGARHYVPDDEPSARAVARGCRAGAGAARRRRAAA